MSDYLSHIATRSSGVVPDNAVSPQGVQSYSTTAFSNDIVEEGNDIVPETRTPEPDAYQNSLDKWLAPDMPIQTIIHKETIFKEQKVKENTASPQYLTKHVERWATENTEKPVFYNRVANIGESEVKDNDLIIDNPNINQQQQNPQYMKPKIQATEEQTLNKKESQNDILVSNILESRNLGTEGGGAFQKKTTDKQDRKFNPLKPSLETNETTNDRIKLRPSTLALETPLAKKATTAPKLVIGRITVQVIPPVSPPVKTIVRTVERGGSGSTTSDNTIHKLSFGLGQL